MVLLSKPAAFAQPPQLVCSANAAGLYNKSTALDPFSGFFGRIANFFLTIFRY